jgi:hypothetical protein
VRYWHTVLVGFLFLFPVAAHAQGCQRTPPHAEEDLQEVALLFRDSAYAEDRGTEIRQLADADPQYVVRDDSVCQAVLDRAVAHMRRNNTIWAAGNEGNFEAVVYRFGPYYAVGLTEETPPVTFENGVLSGFSTGRSPFLIFEAGGLTLVKVLY